jgi:Fic family protein
MVDVSEIARFTLGERTLRLVMDIAAALERYRIVMEGPSGVRLRKLNHIRTVRGTTAIEGNTLTEDQVTDIIAGKRVVGSQNFQLPFLG